MINFKESEEQHSNSLNKFIHWLKAATTMKD